MLFRSVARDGYALDLGTTSVGAGRQEVAFTIRDVTGVPVTEFDVEHEKRLHLIVVRRDQTGFQHVHPVMDEHGTWRTDVTLTPGSHTYRLTYRLADVLAEGDDGQAVLRWDVVPGGWAQAIDRAEVSVQLQIGRAHV